jgi:hypothetical protein
MAMGSTGTVNITPDMLTNAINVIEEYRGTADSLNTSLEQTVTELLASSFSGSAANGFKFFYDNSIAPVINAKKESGGQLAKLLDALHEIMDGTLKAIPGADALDDKLGDGNQKV